MDGKVLVVHPNELVLEVIQEMLQTIGCSVTMATDGQRALAKAMYEHFHLIIVDRDLTEDLDGLGFVERLRRYGVRAPIVGTSPETGWDAPTNSANGDVDLFLSAPFGYGDLVSAVEQLLNRRSARNLPQDLEIQPEPPPSVPGPPVPPAANIPPPADKRNDAVKRPAEPVDGSFRQAQTSVAKKGNSKILIADTDEAERTKLGGLLQKAGYDVALTKSGQEAYEEMLLNDYDMILTDLWLVSMDGFEVIEAVRKSGVTCPIAVQTAYITRDMVKELLAWRVNKIFVKPVHSDALLSFVKKAVPVS